jgi:hypothetical protein
MSYIAKMTKQQIKVYQMAQKPSEGRVLENILLEIVKDKSGVLCATLVATNTYKVIRREIDAGTLVKEGRINIPQHVMKAADKVMSSDDVAFLYDNKLVIKCNPFQESQIVEEDFPSKAEILFTEQTEMHFPETRQLVERKTDCMIPDKIITVDPDLLIKTLQQFKEGKRFVNVKLHIAGANDILIIKADSTFDGNDITAGIMPIRSQE